MKLVFPVLVGLDLVDEDRSVLPSMTEQVSLLASSTFYPAKRRAHVSGFSNEERISTRGKFRLDRVTIYRYSVKKGKVMLKQPIPIISAGLGGLTCKCKL